MGLQDELDAYDRHQRDLEERLDAKTAELIRAQRDGLGQSPLNGALSSPSRVSASSGVDIAAEGSAARAAVAARREAAAPTLTVDAARRRIEKLADLVLEQVR